MLWGSGGGMSGACARAHTTHTDTDIAKEQIAVLLCGLLLYDRWGRCRLPSKRIAYLLTDWPSKKSVFSSSSSSSTSSWPVCCLCIVSVDFCFVVLIRRGLSFCATQRALTASIWATVVCVLCTRARARLKIQIHTAYERAKNPLELHTHTHTNASERLCWPLGHCLQTLQQYITNAFCVFVYAKAEHAQQQASTESHVLCSGIAEVRRLLCVFRSYTMHIAYVLIHSMSASIVWIVCVCVWHGWTANS